MAKKTILTCPHCGHVSEETMRSTDYIERTIRCFECDTMIEAPADAHCVWCAYADPACPIVQNQASCNPVIIPPAR